MHTGKRLKKNFIYNLIYQFLTLIFPLITTPYLSRVLGPEKTGVYSYAYSIAYYFVLFAMLGLNNYGRREIARVQESAVKRSQKFWSIYFMQLMTSGFALILYMGCCLLSGNSHIQWILLIYVLSAVPDISWFFFGMEEFRTAILLHSAVRILAIILILLLVRSSGDLLLYAAMMAGSQLLSRILLWPNLRGRIDWYLPSFPEVLRHFRPNLVLFLPVIAVSLYKVMDKVMLGIMTTYTEVGLYEYSEKVIQIPISCVTALGSVMLPRMSNLAAKKNAQKEYPLIFYSMILGVALTTCASFGLMAVADVFVPFFYGNGYEKCILLFYLLLPSCTFLAIGNVLRTQYLIPHAMDREYIISLLLGAGVNLCANGLLIPRLASFGAAVGTLLAEGTVATVQMYFLRSVLPIGRYLKETAYIVLCASLMLAVVYPIPALYSSFLTLTLKVLAGASVFIPLMLIRYRPLVKKVFPL